MHKAVKRTMHKNPTGVPFPLAERLLNVRGPTAVGRALGAKTFTATSWATRGFVPLRYLSEIAQIAQTTTDEILALSALPSTPEESKPESRSARPPRTRSPWDFPGPYAAQVVDHGDDGLKDMQRDLANVYAAAPEKIRFKKEFFEWLDRQRSDDAVASQRASPAGGKK